jgi:hypothetical protein
LIINELNPGIVVDWTYKENLDNNAMVFKKVFLSFKPYDESFKNYK